MKTSIKASADKIDRHEIEQDAIVSQLNEMSPKQAGEWIDNNVSDLASAKHILKVLAMIAVWLTRKEFKRGE